MAEGSTAGEGRGPSLVAVGGGSGLAVLLRGLKARVDPTDPAAPRLTAVVTVTDDGGSSGRLRRQFGVLPPGDIRNCIAALADDEDLLARLFQYRFPNGAGLTGHSFGNLFLTALTGITGDFYQAILTAESVLSVRGRILPATQEDVRLRARGTSGRVYEGESAIGTSGEPMEAVVLDPPAPPAFPPAAEALRNADLILLGPGSLYTSILPNLLIPGVRSAIRGSSARVILLLNLMTQPGETDGFDGIGHLQAIQNLAGESLVDTVLANAAPPPEQLVRNYADSGSTPVTVDRAAFESVGVDVIEEDLLAEGDLIRHDPARLARVVAGLVPKAS
ncbi:MAG: uridine diphosphate-N-acetylglucosamine-binding protein YvcK [Acidobacteriota bacterium]